MAKRRYFNGDYKRYDYERMAHHIRFKKYVEVHGLTCSECGGLGYFPGACNQWDGQIEPDEYCDWCESTGKMTRKARGEWLFYKRQDALERKEKIHATNP